MTITTTINEAICTYYDKLAAGVPGLKEVLGHEEWTLAGYSEKRQAMAVFFCVPDDRYADRGVKPFVLHEQSDEITIAPEPTAQHLKAYRYPKTREFNPALQYRDLIGGHVMAYKVNRLGISASIVHQWAK